MAFEGQEKLIWTTNLQLISAETLAKSITLWTCFSSAEKRRPFKHLMRMCLKEHSTVPDTY